jgi:hypothetical protein
MIHSAARNESSNLPTPALRSCARDRAGLAGGENGKFRMFAVTMDVNIRHFPEPIT